MANETDQAYHAWPERLYVVSTEGNVVYQGAKGPYGFDPGELQGFLESYLAGERTPDPPDPVARAAARAEVPKP